MPFIELEDVELGMLPPLSGETGMELSASYREAQPFPHIVIDEFITPAILDECLERFPVQPDPLSESFDAEQERLKTSYNPDFLDPRLRAFFYSLNSRPFIQILENITGINGLIPDPYFDGGGFHELKTGGHLSVHADFNLHRKMRLERRVNILIYLNKDWTEADGGQLELWADDMSECLVSVVPKFNRAVIFSTTSTSNHGNPRPIAQPDGRSRKSIALYYYTATWNDGRTQHSTLFRARPGSGDAERFQTDTIRRTRSDVARDLLPPVAFRALKRGKDRWTERKSR